jgi:hypothetical protein
MKAVFLRALEAEDKEGAIKSAKRLLCPEPPYRFDVDPSTFRAVPGSPFAYWASDSLRSLFEGLPRFESEDRTARVGLQTNDDFRWLRVWWEASPDGERSASVVPLAKGGANAPFYADLHTGIRWGVDGKWIKAWKSDQLAKGLITANNSKCWNEAYYMRPGLTWPHRSARFAAAALPAGCVFGQSGKSAFARQEELIGLLALFNSSLMTRLARLQSDAVRIKFEVGLVQRTPIHPRVLADETLRRLACGGWSLRRSLDTRVETSHAFVLPALLQVEGRSLAERADGWAGRVQAVEAELEGIQAEIDERCFDLYGIEEEDRRAISEGLAGAADGVDAEEAAGEVDETDDEQEVEAEVAAAGLAAELVSWAVGVAFGRFDVRLATGQRGLPDEPGPFDPLPVCSPGMLVGGDGLPLASRPPNYPIDFPEGGVLVDDPGDPRDLTAAVRAVFDAVFGGDADARWEETTAVLDPRGHDLRGWLRSSFFERHLRLYSKSRRKAPILWQLGTPSGRYSIWLYAHRLTDDTLFRVQSDVLAPKLAYEERQLTNLVQDAGGSPAARQRREIEAKEAFVEELRLLLAEVRRVAPLWRPTLDDGIVLVMAPLWRLVQHKPWQRELKKKWGELVAGKYDWAQLAMHLWPERVVLKCAEDRSLAIAHGLEDVFWFEDDDGKWQARDEPTQGVDNLVRERASTAVRDALGVTA